jgi:Rho family protein
LELADGREVELSLWYLWYVAIAHLFFSRIYNAFSGIMKATMLVRLTAQSLGIDSHIQHLRYLLYSRADVVVVTFAVDDLESFEDVKDRVSVDAKCVASRYQHRRSQWIPEVRSFIQDTPVLLVGCKGDLRTSPDSHLRCFVPVTEAEGLAATLGLLGYVECSAYDWDGVKNVFKLAAIASLAYRKDESNPTTCTIS